VPMKSVNPATEEVLAEFETLTDAQIETALDRSENAFKSHRKTSFAQRSEWMNAAAGILDDEKESLAKILTLEMGKPISAARAEVEKCALVCRHYAEHAEQMLADRPMPSSATSSFVRYLPIGPVLAVMPWNFPYWQVFRFAAPALMAGNVGLLKHASNVPQSALAIEDVLRRAGFEEGVFQTLLIGSGAVANIVADRRVMAATLTGSEPAGAAVAAQAGKALKKTVLELGGSDAFVVMPSADLDKTLDMAVTARNLNNGQSCIAAKRFIVHADIYDTFEAGFADRMTNVAVGDPMDEATQIGPLALGQIRDEIDEQVERSVDAGARRVCGAKRLGGKGYFYAPGILADIPESSPAFAEEIFGPVALLHKVGGLDEAISLANATRFGLGSSIWTTDEAEMVQAIQELEAGATFVNSIVASDPRLPFGGVKASGYGRELADVGMIEFMNQKTVYIA
jgi:succinate-semialdehyde dehydrogenase / glutarate-semialdehyde dehydrogenase